jgi:TPR repeat protein
MNDTKLPSVGPAHSALPTEPTDLVARGLEAIRSNGAELGVVKNETEDFASLRLAAEAGDAEAQFKLGRMYFDGDRVEKDYHEAAEWIHQAAWQSHVLAQAFLGWMYYDGAGVEKNDHEAVEWYRKAAERGDVSAQFSLGRMYYFGEGIVVKNHRKAVEWYSRAAEQGDADAQFNLGMMYYFGQGVERSDRWARAWIRKAAAQNHVIAGKFLVDTWH